MKKNFVKEKKNLMSGEIDKQFVEQKKWAEENKVNLEETKVIS